MTDFIGSSRNQTNQNTWTRVGRRDLNTWSSSGATKRRNNKNSWGKPIMASHPPEDSPIQQDTGAWQVPKETSGWDTPVDTNQNPWATNPAPVDVNWGDMESSIIPAPQEEWVYQDPNAPLELTSLNLAAYCNPVDDWNTKAKSPQEYHQLKKREKIEQWVMEGTEEEKNPNLNFKGVRKFWKPFSNRSGVLPGAYS